MRTSVQLRIGRVTRRTWAFPALVVAAVLPHLLLVYGERMGDPPWTDAQFWPLAAGCFIAPAVFIGGMIAGLRVSGRGPRIGLAFAVAACLAVSGDLLGMVTLAAGEIGKSAVRVATVVPPLRRAMQVPPAEAALRAFDAGDPAFLGSLVIFGLNVPEVSSCAVLHRYGVRLIEVRVIPFTPAEQRFDRQAQAYALAYNRAMAGYLHLSPADLAEPADCFANPRIRAWLSGAEIHE